MLLSPSCLFLARLPHLRLLKVLAPLPLVLVALFVAPEVLIHKEEALAARFSLLLEGALFPALEIETLFQLYFLPESLS
jgi:hypothetical protein